MADEKLILVERFDELKAGMRVVVKRCNWGCGCHVGVLGALADGRTVSVSGERAVEPRMKLLGSSCSGGRTLAIARSTVADRKVYRYASDLDMERELAAEENPYKVYTGYKRVAVAFGKLPR